MTDGLIATIDPYNLYIWYENKNRRKRKMKRLREKALAAGLAAMLLFTGCAHNVPAQTEPLKNDPALKTEIKLVDVSQQKIDEAKMNDEYGRYTFELMKKVSENAKKSNVMISPASIMMALDMVAAGAKGETLKQLNDLFAKDTDSLEQQAFASELMKRFNASQKVKFACANAIWSDSRRLGDKVNAQYTEYIKKTFEAEFSSVLFDGNTHNTINKWVDEKTNHMIPTLFDSPLDPNTVMVLVNAIRFEAEWNQAYTKDQIIKKIFRGTDGEKEATMLTSTENEYFETDKAKGFLKLYQGEEYAFLVILPKDEKIDANEFIKNFTYDDYKEFLASRSKDEVRALMPEFKSDYAVGLNEILKQLGVTDAFSDAKADLTGIANPQGGRLFVSKVIHKSHIEVDRKGTKAAAATGITLDVKGAAPVKDLKEVICDRPYAYAIVDTVSMNPVFIGTVNNVG